MRSKSGGIIVNTPTPGELLFRAWQLQGEPPEALDPTFNASAQVADLTAPEYAWLRREKRYIGYCTTGAAAGNNSQAELRNPAGSGLMATVDRIIIQNGATAGAIGIFMSVVVNLGLGAQIRITSLDARQEGSGILSQPIPGLTMAAGNSVFAGAAQAVLIPVAANVRLVLDIPFVLIEDTYLRTYHTVANAAYEINFQWRERRPVPSEDQR